MYIYKVVKTLEENSMHTVGNDNTIETATYVLMSRDGTCINVTLRTASVVDLLMYW